MTDIQAELNSKNINNDNQISQDIIEKYEIFKKWLNDNGAIYPKLFFPVKFSNIIGCQALEDINPNSCILYIPYKLLIDASNVKLDYIPEGLKKNNTIKLVLFLLEEYEKKEKSFYKPYLDIILLNDFSNYTPFWSKDDFLELNDEMVEENINYYINEITEYSYEIFGENKNEKKVGFHTV